MNEFIKALEDLIYAQEAKGIIVTDIKLDVKRSSIIESIGIAITCEKIRKNN